MLWTTGNISFYTKAYSPVLKIAEVNNIYLYQLMLHNYSNRTLRKTNWGENSFMKKVIQNNESRENITKAIE